jgi:MFS family permease
MTMRSPETEQTSLDTKRTIAVTKSGISREENSALSLSEALRTAPFWQLFCVFALCIWSLGIAMIHLVPFAQDIGLPAIPAAGLITTIGICGIVGRVMSGFLSDRFGSRPILLLGILVQSVMILLLLKASSLWIFYFFAIFFGLSYGGNIVLIPKLTANIFGLNSMATIFGALSVADGIGYGTGSLIAGYIFEITGSYNISFLAIAGGLAAAAFLTMILKEKPTK